MEANCSYFQMMQSPAASTLIANLGEEKFAIVVLRASSNKTFSPILVLGGKGQLLQQLVRISSPMRRRIRDPACLSLHRHGFVERTDRLADGTMATEYQPDTMVMRSFKIMRAGTENDRTVDRSTDCLDV